jgi:hypothetical protein
MYVGSILLNVEGSYYILMAIYRNTVNVLLKFSLKIIGVKAVSFVI